MILNGGKAIRHPNFNDKLLSLYENSCHLSFIGYDIFLIHFKEIYVHLLTIQQHSGLTYCGGIFDIP